MNRQMKGPKAMNNHQEPFFSTAPRHLEAGESPQTIYEIPEQGRFLLEANAGSGKTWQMATLFVWLLAKGKPLEHIVVTTFTNNAAEELSTRIRDKILACLHPLRIMNANGIPSLQEYSAAELPEEVWAIWKPNTSAIYARLLLASQQLERLRVLTLHGYFLSLLKDNAILAQIPIPCEIMEEEPVAALRLASSSAVWRQAMMTKALDSIPLPQGALDFLAWSSGQVSTDLEAFSTNETLGRQVFFETCFPAPEALASILKVFFDHPNLPLLPITRRVTSPPVEFATVQRLAQSLATHFQALEKALSSAGLNGQIYKPHLISQKLKALQLALEKCQCGERINLKQEKDIRDLFPDQLIAKRTKIAQKSHPRWMPPAILAECESLLEAQWAWSASAENTVHSAFIEWAKNAALEHFHRHLQSSLPFSVVIHRAHHWLVLSAQAPTLLAAAKQKTSVWLVDEFQDTDQQQWEVLHALQAPLEDQPPGLLVAVGDPKQAIYRFRGADINAYLQARLLMSAPTLTLTDNYRAQPSMVRAVNAWFTPTDDQPSFFYHHDIHYRPSQANRSASDDALPAIATPARLVPLQAGKLFVGQAVQHALSTYASLLMRHRPFTAVALVDTNAQGERVATAAGEMGLRVRFQSSRFRWQTSLRWWHGWLSALLLEDSRAILSRLIFSPLLPTLPTEAIQRYLTDEAWQEDPRWEMVLQFIESSRQVWHRQGILALWQGWVAGGLRERLLAFGQTAREVSALDHWVEPLLRVSPLPMQQVAWLDAIWQGKINFTLPMPHDQPEPGVLEIATIHRAKGLQWDLVLAPFILSPKRLGGRNKIQIHRVIQDGKWMALVGKEAGIETRWIEQIQLAESQEAMRVHYVAMTRAVSRLVVYLPKAKQESKHPCAPVVNHFNRLPPESMAALGWQVVDATFPAFDAVDGDVDELNAASVKAEESRDATRVTKADRPNLNALLAPFSALQEIPTVAMAHIEKHWHQTIPTSFTSLYRGWHTHATTPDANVDQPPVLMPDNNITSPSAGGDDESLGELLLPINIPPATVALIAEADQYQTSGDSPSDLALPVDTLPLVASPLHGKALGIAVHAFIADVISRRQPLTRLGATRVQHHALIDEVAVNLHSDALVAALARVALESPWPFLPSAAPGHLALPESEVAEWGFVLSWRQHNTTSFARTWQAFIDALALPPIRCPEVGQLTGSLDWLLQVKGRYTVVDFKTNLLTDYSLETLENAVRSHGYHLQAAIYQYALHCHLQQCLPNYQPALHLGGCEFLFLRAGYEPAENTEAVNPLALGRVHIPVDNEVLAMMAELFTQEIV